MISAVYHWFDAEEDSPPYANLRVPIIVSIATLRAVNPHIPIIVLAQDHRDWGHFPEKLNFRVKRIQFSLERFKDRIKGWRHLSRLLDVQLGVQDGVYDTMYVDSDVFWFRDPLPLTCNLNKFCFDGWNTGFYYQQRMSRNSLEFFDVFDTYTKAAIYSQDIRQMMVKHIGYDAWYEVWDEMILAYMKDRHPELFHIIPPEEHCSARSLERTNLDEVKMFHCNGTMVPNEINESQHSRGLLGLLIKEFHDNMLKVLDERDMRHIYSLQEMSYYLPHQFSLLKEPYRLIKTKDEDGHFHAEKCLRPQRTLI
jgi:hypothetical protein